MTVEIDSGPAYTVGALQIEGLSRYDAALVERYNPFKPGDPYDRPKLVEFQQALQDTPYFANAVATLQLSPEQPEQVPLKVVIRESRSKRISTGVGYETNTGAHVEVAYRQNQLFGNPWVLQTGARLDQTGGFGYADVLLPPRPNGIQDSVGALVEDSEIEDLRVRRWGLGAARSRTVGPRAGNNVVTKLVGQLRTREPPHADHRLAEPRRPVDHLQLGPAQGQQRGRAAQRQHHPARGHRRCERHPAERRLPPRLRTRPAVLPDRRARRR